MPYRLSEQKKAERLLLALEKKRKQLEPENQPDWFYDSFPEQKEFILNPAKKKAGLTTRRSGKSMGAAIALLKTAYENAGCNCLFVGLSRASAKDIIWKDCLKVLDRRLKLEARFNESALTVTLPNGSVISVIGLDADEGQPEKVRGKKFKLVIVDEAASFTIDLEATIKKVIEPCLPEVEGSLWMLGTPNNITSGYFYSISTRQKKEGWKTFSWTYKENTATPEGENERVCDRWTKYVEQLKIDIPGIEETAAFKQEYEGAWVVNEDGLVYRFYPEKNFCQSVPSVVKGRWHKVLGVDFGIRDDQAFSLLAYHDHLPEVYVLESSKKKGMDITDVAERIKEYRQRHEIEVVVGDSAAAQAIAELNNRHGIGMIPTPNKVDKFGYIELMNADLFRSKIKLVQPGNEQLVTEWSSIILDERALRVQRKLQERASCPNHIADATLYAWRYCFSYLHEAIVPVLPHDSEEYWLQKEREEEEREIEQERRRSGAMLDDVSSFEWID